MMDKDNKIKNSTAKIDKRFNPNSVIINEQDLELFKGISAYKLAIEKQCAEMLLATKIECENMVQKTKEECSELKTAQLIESNTKLLELSQQLQQENYDLLKKFLTDIEEDIFGVCYKIIAKLHIAEISAQQLLNLIKEELTQYSQAAQITVSSNAVNIDFLKNNLKLYNKKIIYITKENLEPSQCIVSDGLATIYVDLKKCSEHIMNHLNGLINKHTDAVDNLSDRSIHE